MNRSDIKITESLDTSGKCCPMPMVASNKAIRKLQGGEVLEIIATDQATQGDIPSWCERTGNELLLAEEIDKTFKYYVRKS